MNFLPEGYDVPNKAGNYMRFEDGANRFRILASPIVGWEAWETGNDGSRKPIRRRMSDLFKASEVEEPENIKHFWAMPVWNYKEERIQILEITQKSIQKSIKALAADEDWGSPFQYDIVVTKTGQKLDTKYNVQPKPAKKLDEGIAQLYMDMHINLEALYSGGDPFVETEPEINVNEVADAIG